jgi:hypothetical protein
VDGSVSMVEEASEGGEGEDSDGIYGAVDGLQAQMDARARNTARVIGTNDSVFNA